MGNCFRHPSSMVWAGDEWDCVIPNQPHAEKQSLLGGDGDDGDENRAFTSSANRQVKIRMSKKQLQELLASADVHDMPVEHVLTSLMDAGDRFESQHQQPWRPALQSIPEVN